MHETLNELQDKFKLNKRVGYKNSQTESLFAKLYYISFKPALSFGVLTC